MSTVEEHSESGLPETEADRYRFSGYQLQQICLTAGFPDYVVPVHPYFYNQPLEWTKPAYTKYSSTGPQVLEGNYPIQPGYSNTSNGRMVVSGSSGSSSAIIRGGSKKAIDDEPRIDLLPI